MFFLEQPYEVYNLTTDLGTTRYPTGLVSLGQQVAEPGSSTRWSASTAHVYTAVKVTGIYYVHTDVYLL